ncbi:hypothetical protein AX15_006161 [Amanita polypyramis BW_CC]|nr:hypothetical protein AX15_006161 [Amanita polypyramis BW_CC]
MMHDPLDATCLVTTVGWASPLSTRFLFMQVLPDDDKNAATTCTSCGLHVLCSVDRSKTTFRSKTISLTKIIVLWHRGSDCTFPAELGYGSSPGM